MTKIALIGTIMINRFVDRFSAHFSPLTLLLVVTVNNGYAASEPQISFAPHQYLSSAEFAQSVCLPCHYRNMPPDKIYRKTLLLKFTRSNNAPAFI